MPGSSFSTAPRERTGDDFLSGGDGNDHIFGGDGSDKANGSAGDDVMFGGLGNDDLHGNAGDDGSTAATEPTLARAAAAPTRSRNATTRPTRSALAEPPHRRRSSQRRRTTGAPLASVDGAARTHSSGEDFPRWYQDVITKAELAENGPVRGTMVIRPTAYAIWERLQSEMDARIKAAGVDNAYFPLFIPQEYLRKKPNTSRASRPSSRSSPTAAARNSTSRSSCGPRARRSSTRTSRSGCRATATCRC